MYLYDIIAQVLPSQAHHLLAHESEQTITHSYLQFTREPDSGKVPERRIYAITVDRLLVVTITLKFLENSKVDTGEITVAEFPLKHAVAVRQNYTFKLHQELPIIADSQAVFTLQFSGESGLGEVTIVPPGREQGGSEYEDFCTFLRSIPR